MDKEEKRKYCLFLRFPWSIVCYCVLSKIILILNYITFQIFMTFHFLTAIKVRSNFIFQVKDVHLFLDRFIFINSFMLSGPSDRGQNKVVDESQTLLTGNLIFFNRKISGTLNGNIRAESESYSVIFIG